MMPKVVDINATKPDAELARLIDAVEDMREQLEARDSRPEDINQMLGTCLAVYLLQRL